MHWTITVRDSSENKFTILNESRGDAPKRGNRKHGSWEKAKTCTICGGGMYEQWERVL